MDANRQPGMRLRFGKGERSFSRPSIITVMILSGLVLSDKLDVPLVGT